MNRILVAALKPSTTFTSTNSVENPVLKSKASQLTVELRYHTYANKAHNTVQVSMPYVIDKAVSHVRVVEMSAPAIVTMETGDG